MFLSLPDSGLWIGTAPTGHLQKTIYNMAIGVVVLEAGP